MFVRDTHLLAKLLFIVKIFYFTLSSRYTFLFRYKRLSRQSYRHVKYPKKISMECTFSCVYLAQKYRKYNLLISFRTRGINWYKILAVWYQVWLGLHELARVKISGFLNIFLAQDRY